MKFRFGGRNNLAMDEAFLVRKKRCFPDDVVGMRANMWYFEINQTAVQLVFYALQNISQQINLHTSSEHRLSFQQNNDSTIQ